MEIEGLDIVDVTTQMKRRQGRYLALLLTDIEEVLGGNSEEFIVIRKLVLDHFNDYTRSIFRIIFGNEVEGLEYR